MLDFLIEPKTDDEHAFLSDDDLQRVMEVRLLNQQMCDACVFVCVCLCDCMRVRVLCVRACAFAFASLVVFFIHFLLLSFR